MLRSGFRTETIFEILLSNLLQLIMSFLGVEHALKRIHTSLARPQLKNNFCRMRVEKGEIFGSSHRVFTSFFLKWRTSG